MSFVPSPQQAAFFHWAQNGTGSCVLEAVAGSGKSTTLLRSVPLFAGQIALMAYNKAIADELKAKLEKAGHDWKKAQAGTAHSFGFAAYRKAYPGVKLDDKKVEKIFDAQIFETHPLQPHRSKILQLVSLAKQAGVGFLLRFDNDQVWYDIVDHYDIAASDDDEHFPVEEVVSAARGILSRSAAITDVIDFDDMIYMPLLKRVRFWQYDVVMVDEAQDTNATRRALVRALVRRGGRVVAVGDRHQAIYGFTGADSDSLDLIRQDFNACEMPLTVTYRCPRAVVLFAQQWVSHIHAAASAPEGSVESVALDNFLAETKDLSHEDVVLCRNTRPLVELALRLIRGGTACRVEGRDIVEGLKKLARRWKIKTISALEGKLETYLEKQRTALLAKKQESRYATLEDTVETLRVVMAACMAEQQFTVEHVVARLEALFSDGSARVLTLSTIHRSKGREWERVFWLDRQGTLPSPWARQEWQQEQELNLCYVAATRAKHRLIEIIVPKSRDR